jgi:hypothetical protein
MDETKKGIWTTDDMGRPKLIEWPAPQRPSLGSVLSAWFTAAVCSACVLGGFVADML